MVAVELRPFIFPADAASATTEEECEALFRLATGKRVLEVGVWKGRATIAMAQSARVVHAVDWFMGDRHTGETFIFPEFYANLRRYGALGKVVIHWGTFEEVLPLFADDVFDFAFLDGFHTYEATKEVYDWVNPLANVLAFHDYGRDELTNQAGEHFGVTKVVDELGGPSERYGSIAVLD
jgi:hypothetical protein